MNTQGSSWVWQKKSCRWFLPRSLIRTSGTHCSLVLGYIMPDWMIRIDHWSRNFLPTIRSRQFFTNLIIFVFYTLLFQITVSIFPINLPDIVVACIGTGLYQHFGMGCKSSSSSSYNKGLEIALLTSYCLNIFQSFWSFPFQYLNSPLCIMGMVLRIFFHFQGTEYYDGKSKRYVDFPITDILQMMGRAGRPQYDQHGKAVILVHEPKKSFYKKVT